VIVLPVAERDQQEQVTQLGQPLRFQTVPQKKRWNSACVTLCCRRVQRGSSSEMNHLTSSVYPLAKNHQNRYGSNEFC